MDGMTYVNGKPLTQEYLDYLKDKAKFEGKLEVMREIVELTKRGMKVWDAIDYILEEMKREESELNR